MGGSSFAAGAICAAKRKIALLACLRLTKLLRRLYMYVHFLAKMPKIALFSPLARSALAGLVYYLLARCKHKTKPLRVRSFRVLSASCGSKQCVSLPRLDVLRYI